MKTIKNYDFKVDSIKSKIESRKVYINDIITRLNGYKESEDMTVILLNDIHRTKFEIRLLELRLKTINLIKKIINKVTA